MSVAVSGVVWKSGPCERNQRFVLLAIADNASDEGYAFPLVSTIADKCVMTPRNVLRILKILADDGWISISVSPKNHKANAYQINLAKVSGDKMSRDKSGSSQVTKSSFSGDKPGITILSNVKELSIELSVVSIYGRYPRRVGRTPALKAIQKSLARLAKGESGKPLTSKQAFSLLEEKTIAFAASPAGRAGEFTPHPATWFNASRYLDDPEEWGKGEIEVKPLTIAEKMRKDGF